MLSRFLVASRLPARTAYRTLPNPTPSRAIRAPRRAFSASRARHDASASNAKCSCNEARGTSAGTHILWGMLIAYSFLVAGQALYHGATRVPEIDNTPIAVRRVAAKSFEKEVAASSAGRYYVRDESGNLIEIEGGYGGEPAKWLEGQITIRRLIEDGKERAEKLKNDKEMREQDELITRRKMELSGYSFVEKTANGVPVYKRDEHIFHGMPTNAPVIPGIALTTGNSSPSEVGTGFAIRRPKHGNESQNGTGNCPGNFDGSRRQNENGGQIGIGNFHGSGAPHQRGTRDNNGGENLNGDTHPNWIGAVDGGENQSGSALPNGTGAVDGGGDQSGSAHPGGTGTTKGTGNQSGGAHPNGSGSPNGNGGFWRSW